MKSVLKNIISVIAGLILGSAVNMALIMISGSIIPPPEGVDSSTMDGLKSGMLLFETKHFLFPFLAHSLGTFFGAILTAIIADRHKMNFALAVGLLFLLGGCVNIFMLPSPLWFTLTDLIGAYIPMAWMGGMIGKRF